MNKKLVNCKQHFNSFISPAQRVKDKMLTSLNEVRNRHDSWEKSNDARSAWFSGARKILSITQLQLLFARDNLCTKAWWKKGKRDISEKDIGDLVHEYDVQIRWTLSNMLFAITEELLRDAVRALPDIPESITKTSHYSAIYKYLLKSVGKTSYLEIFDFHRLIRNTVHTNGVYRPYDNRKQDKLFLGETYHFRVGEKINFITYDLLYELANSYNKAVFDVVTAEKIESLDHVERYK